MHRESEARRGPRRPRRDRDRERDRDRDRDPAEVKERIDQEFAREMEMRISYFLQSQEQELELEAMNSYRRRMVHSIAGKYHLRSESRGEDRERYVCLVKTDETPAPGEAPAPSARPAPASEEPSASGERPSASRERPPTSHEDAPARPVRLWDFGTQTFPVNPGQNGIRMALKVDGSLELYRERDRAHVLTDRVITSREFRVRQGKLLMPGESGY